MNEFNTIIIGGGPAGLFTAISINESQRVLVLEKNDIAGKKLLMAGAGKCNITHSGDIGEFLKHYGDNFRFLKKALRHFTNNNLINFFKARGLSTITDNNGKVFPSTENSKDVLEVLIQACKENKITMRYNEAALTIEKREDRFWVTTKNDEYSCNYLVISTGGNSFPSTGSSGDGYHFAKTLGHTITPIKPSLTPVFIREYKFTEIAGVSLQNKTIYLYRNNKKINEHHGDIGFTHKGLSGPGILDFSRYFENGDTLKVNFINENAEDFRRLFIEASTKEGKISLKRFLKRYEIPESLIKIILAQLHINSNETLATIDKKTRNHLVNAFCEHPFYIEKVGGFKIAMATSGGVALTEVSQKTMESKQTDNLYFTGEVLDIDGDTGGYNIQAAFSTGAAAAAAINLK